jgi:hypothetical protein
VAFVVDVSLRAAGCHLAARHKGGRGVGDLWGQREAHLHVEVVGPELQLLRPLPANGRSRGEKCVVSIVFGVGSHHLDALGLAELCGELSHERLAQSRRAIKTEAESLGVLDHAREEVVGEVADTCSSLVIAADEDNEPLVGKGVQQKGGLEFLSATFFWLIDDLMFAFSPYRLLVEAIPPRSVTATVRRQIYSPCSRRQASGRPLGVGPLEQPCSVRPARFGQAHCS